MKPCKDWNCPFHGNLKLKKRRLSGTVSSARMRRTVNVSRERRILIPKYERFAKRYYSLKAHNPDCISAKEGDEVILAECRPVSKSKHFVAIKKSGGKSGEVK